MDLNYLPGMNVDDMGYPEGYNWSNFTLGISYQLEFVFDKLSIVCAVGNYPKHQTYKPYRQFYQRLGIKHYLLKDLYAGVNIRTINFATAEFLEFSLGYRIWSATRKKVKA